MSDSTEPRMEGMGTEAFAVAPFFWSGKAHGQQRNTHLQSCSIASWRTGATTLRQPRLFPG